MMNLSGRRALVTGGAQGIGAATVEALSGAGASVVVADIDAARADQVATDFGASAIELDVTDFGAVAREIGALGPIDILVNNAGADQHAFFTETTASDWQRLLRVNLEAAMACTQAVLPAMQAAEYGRIVNVVSEAGRLGSRGGSVYAAAKGGLIAFTKSIARENARYRITANAVAPGPIRTPMVDRAVAAGGDKLLRAMEGTTLLNRLGEPAEVAVAVLFLASDEASFITGETLGVSGGMGIGAG